MKQGDIIKEFLSRINDSTGTVRRYAESICNETLWQVKEKSNE